MEVESLFIVSLLSLITLSCEQFISVKDDKAQLQDEFKSTQRTNQLHFARLLGDSNAQFALELYREITANAKSDENILLSPFSISVCMAMILMGSNRDTARQISEVLHYDSVNDMVHEAFRQTIAILNSTSNPYELKIANRLFAGNNLQSKPSYARYIERFYGSTLQMLDFTRDASRIYINDWVAAQTNGHILELLPHGALDPLNPLVIINAIFFKGQWMNAFPAQRTRKKYFNTGLVEELREVDMMSNSGLTLNYTHMQSLGGLKVVELPYDGQDVSLYVFLPDQPGGLPELESKLTFNRINNIINSLQEKQLDDLQIPKFSIKNKMDLRDTLMKLGLTDVFGAQRDLDGMIFDCPGIEEVYHEAYIDVSEEGTEAAAATAGAGRRNAQLNPITFQADRPFLFLIREKSTKTLLFLGRFTTPTFN